MKRKSIFFAALASLALATSCSQDELKPSMLSNSEIRLNASVHVNSVGTKAVETTTKNLGGFTVNAFVSGEANYMSDVKYTSSNGTDWTTTAGTFYWPTGKDLNFYCYAPETPGKDGTFKFDKDYQTLTDYSPYGTAAEQQDFVYAKATGNETDNSKGVEINFQHALSEVTISAKNENPAYTVEVSGVKIGNVKSVGDFTFPSVNGAAAYWVLSSDVADYATEWATATTLGEEATKMDESNVAFMLLPQQLEKATVASDKNYIALKVKITDQGGNIAYNGWSLVGIDTNWEMGKRYDYTVDFTPGAGQDESGKLVYSNANVDYSLSVAAWEANDIELPVVKAYDANSIVISERGTAYGIDVSRANSFWSNTDVGDESNVIGADTEWTAEVIWQDIPSRVINFCSKYGLTKSGDTFEGKGLTPFFVKTTSAAKGNVVVGIKKKGETDYLWSWHLWLTDEPQEIAGFMDRNLGATSATATDGEKTYGLYYQFGRKDPFVGNTEKYNINGKSIGTDVTIEKSQVTFAQAVQTPAIFYIHSNSVHDWASPNNYKSKDWNDISESNGKSFFDPCPEGWRLPTITELADFSSSTTTWDATNKGRTYKGNWFPAAGLRNKDSDGSLHSVGTNGAYFSVSPIFNDCGKGMGFYTDEYVEGGNMGGWSRYNGMSLRCVPE